MSISINRYQLEALEARLLLSADGLAVAPENVSGSSDVVEEQSIADVTSIEESARHADSADAFAGIEGVDLDVDIEPFIAGANNIAIETVVGNHVENTLLIAEVDGRNPGSGAGFHDLLNVTGQLTLGGDLLVDFTPAFQSQVEVGDAFTIINYGSLVGDFASISVEGSAPTSNTLVSSVGLKIDPEVTANAYIINVIIEDLFQDLTQASDIEISNNLRVHTDRVIETDGDLIIDGNLLGNGDVTADNIIIRAGGSVTVTGDIGGSGLNNVTIESATSVDIQGAVNIDGNLVINGDGAAGGVLTTPVQPTSVSFGGSVSADSIDVTATNQLSFGADVAATDGDAAFELTSPTGDLTILGALTATGNAEIVSADAASIGSFDITGSFAQLAGNGLTTIGGTASASAISIVTDSITFANTVTTTAGDIELIADSNSGTVQLSGAVDSAGAFTINAAQNVTTASITAAGSIAQVDGAGLSTFGTLEGADISIVNEDLTFTSSVTSTTGDISFEVDPSLGAINVSGTVDSAGDVTIVAAEDVNLASVIAGGAFVQQAGSGTTDIGGTVDAASVTMTAINFVFSGTVTTTAGSVSITADPTSGTIDFQDAVSSAADVEFVSAQHVLTEAITAVGAINQLAGTGTTQFQDDLLAASVSIRTFVLIQADAGIEVSTGDILLEADEIDLLGGFASVQTTGATNITLIPATVSASIDIGNPVGGTGTLAISDTDIAAIQNGFSRITIGRELDGTGAVTIGSATFLDPVEIFGLTISSDEIFRAESVLYSANGDITVLNNIIADFDIVFDTNRNFGDISVQGIVQAGQTVRVIDADTVEFRDDMFAGALDVSARSTADFRGDVLLTGGGATIAVSETFGEVRFQGTLTSVGALSVPTAFTAQFLGNVQVASADVNSFEQIDFLGNVSTTSGNLAVSADVGTGMIAFRGTVTTVGDLTIAATHDATFQFGATVGGNLEQLSGSGETRFSANVSADDISLVTGDLISFFGLVEVTVGDIFLEADEINLDGGFNSVRGLTTSVIALRPASSGASISIGFPFGSAGVLDLSDADISAIRDGFAKIIIGRPTDGNGSVELGTIGTVATIEFLDPVELYGGNLQVNHRTDAAESMLLDFEESIVIDALVTATEDLTAEAGLNVEQNANISSADGNLTVVAEAGFIQMADGAAGSTGTGNIDYTAFLDIDVSLLQSTSGNIRVTAGSASSTTGAIVDITADETANFITSGRVSLTAETGIGEADAEDIDLTTASLEAVNRTSGDVFLEETAALTIVGSGLQTLAGNGSISLIVNSDSAVVNRLISAHGSGDVTVDVETGALTLNDPVNSGTGAIDLAASAIAQNAGSQISTGGGGAILLTARAGEITQVSGEIIQSASGAITLYASGSVLLSIIQSTSGDVSLIAGSGSSISGQISDNLASEAANVSTSGLLSMTAETGIGASGAADIDTAIGSLQATTATSGSIFIDEADTLAISGTGLAIAAGGGDIVVAVQLGSLNVASVVSAQAGDILLITNGGAGTSAITLNANVMSASGDLTINSNSGISIADSVVVSTAGSGMVSVQAVSGAISMAVTSSVVTSGANVALIASGDVSLGVVDTRSNPDILTQANWGSVAIVAGGAIRDAAIFDAGVIDIYANGIILSAVTSVGRSGIDVNPIDVEAATLAAVTTGSTDPNNHGIVVADPTNIQIGTVAAISTSVVDLGGSSASAVASPGVSEVTLTGSGQIVLTSLGAIQLVDGNADGNSITVTASGNIRVSGLTGIDAQADIETADGSLSLVSGAGITLGSAALLSTGGGDAVITAAAGSVAMDPDAVADSDGGAIRVSASGDILLGLLDAASAGTQGTWGDVSIASAAGAVLDVSSNDTTVDIFANDLRIEAAVGVGNPAQAIEVEVIRLAGLAGSGGYSVVDVSDVTIGEVSEVPANLVDLRGTTELVDDAEPLADITVSGTGSAAITATGDLVLNDGDSDEVAIDIIGSGGATLSATGTNGNGDIFLNAGVAAVSGNLILIADGDVIAGVLGDITTGGSGSVSVTATNGAVTMADGARFATDSGDITLDADLAIALGLLHTTSGDVAISSGTSISDATLSETPNIITGAKVSFAAETGVGGTGAADIDISAASLEATNATSGDIVIEEASGLAIVDSGVETQGGNGRVSLRLLAGTLSVEAPVSAHGSGVVGLFVASSVSTDTISIASTVSSATGHITVNAADNIDLATSGSIATGGSGTISVTAVSGRIDMAPASSISTDGENIRLTAGTTAVIGLIDARSAGVQSTWGNVSITANAGGIRDASTAGDNTLNIFANQLRFLAANNFGEVGTASNPLEIEVVTVAGTLTAAPTAGVHGVSIIDLTSIAVSEVDTVLVTVIDAGFVSSALASSGNLSDITSSGNGSVALATEDGSLIIQDGGDADAAGIVTEGAGNVYLATGLSGDGEITLLSDVLFGSGAAELNASDAISLNTGSVIATSTGTAYLVAADAVTMAASEGVQTNGGNIRIDAGTGITVGLVDARTDFNRLTGLTTNQANWGDVLLMASGSIIDAAAAGDSTIDIFADRLRVETGNSFGELADNAIETELIRLAATVGGGGLRIAEATNLVIDSAGAIPVGNLSLSTVAVALNASTPFSDVSSSGNGDLVIVVNDGSLTLNDGLDGDGSAVSANGSGNILLSASQVFGPGTITANASVTSGVGNITVAADQRISITGTASVETANPGSVFLTSGNADIVMGPAAMVAVDGGNIRLNAATAVVAGIIDSSRSGNADASTWGSVAITAGTTVTDAEDGELVNITANQVRFAAGNSVGQLGASANAIETSVETVSAVTNSGNGGINLLDLSAVAVGGVLPVAVNQVAEDALTSVVTDGAAQSDLTASSDGSIVIQSASGIVTLLDGSDGDGVAINGSGAGNVRVESRSGGVDILADIETVTGSISIFATGEISLGSGTGVFAVDAGTIEVVTTGGSVVFAADAVLETDAENIRIFADQNIVLGLLDTRTDADRGGSLTNQATWGSVALRTTTGAITSPEADTRVFSRGLRAEAGAAVGVLGASPSPLQVEVLSLSGSAGSGGFNVEDASNLAVDDVSAVSINTVARTGLASASALVSGLSDIVISNGGSLVLATPSGNLTANDGTFPSDSNAVLLTGNSGNEVLLTASGVVTISGSVETQAGSISVFGSSVLLDSDLVVTGSGTVDLESDTGNLTMAALSRIITNGGNVRMTSAGDVSLQLIDARVAADRAAGALVNQSSWGSVGVFAPSGGAVDTTNTAATNVFADGLRIEVADGIGAFAIENPIETEVAVLALRSGGTGIRISEASSVAVDSVDTVSVDRVDLGALTSVLASADLLSDIVVASNGALGLTVGGDLTVNDGTDPANGGGIDVQGDGNVLLSVGLAGSGDMEILADIATGGGAVSLAAADDVLIEALVSLTGSGTADVVAGGDISMSADGVFETDAANIRLLADNDIALGIVDARTLADRASGSITGQSGWGDISLVAVNGSITDQNDSGSANVFANSFRAEAGVGIGALPTVNPVDLEVSRAAVRAGSGGLSLNDLTSIEIDDVGLVPIDRVASDSLTTVVESTNPLSDARTSNGGDIVLSTADGSITVNDGTAAAGSTGITALGGGNILLAANSVTNAAALTLNADLFATGGSVSLAAVDDITINSLISLEGLGTLTATSSLGSIIMVDGSSISTIGANVRLEANDSISIETIDLRSELTRNNGGLSDQANWGALSLITANGSVVDTSGNGDTNVRSSGIRIDAGFGFGELGAAVDAIETETAVIAGTAGEGGINLLDSSSIRIDTVSEIIADLVLSSGQTTSVDSGSQTSDIVIDNGGAFVLSVSAGGITVADGVDAGPDSVVLTGTGGNSNLRFSAPAGAITVNSGINSDDGNLSLVARDAVELNANVTTGEDGTFLIESTTDSVRFAGITVQTDGGNGRILASVGIDLGTVDLRTVPGRAGGGFTDQENWGSVAAIAGTGAIQDGNLDLTPNVLANEVRFNAATGIGASSQPADAIDLEARIATAVTTTGAIILVDASDITVDQVVTVDVLETLADASTSTASDTQAQEDVVNAGMGIVVLRALDGSIMFNDSVDGGSGVISAGGGNIGVFAESTSRTGSISVNGDITSDGGNITLLANDDISTTGLIATNGSGTIDLDATNGSFAQTIGSTVRTVGGNIRLFAGTDASIALLDARTVSDRVNGTLAAQSTWGAISVIADSGSIADISSNSNVNIFSSATALVAADSVGTLGAIDHDPIEIETVTLAVSSGLGGIAVTESTSVTVGTISPVGVNQVDALGASALAALGSAVSDVSTVDGGSIAFLVLNGTLTVNDGIDADGIGFASSGTISAGNILVSAVNAGNTADLVLNADVRSTQGSISLIADDAIQSTSSVVTGASGTIDIFAGDGAIAFGLDSVVQTSGGNARLNASESVVLPLVDLRVDADRSASTVASQGSWGSLSVIAGNGSITDANAADASVFAQTARFISTGSIGSLGGASDPIEVEVSVLAAVTGGGGISFIEATSVTVDTVGRVPLFRVEASGLANSTVIQDSAVISDLSTVAGGTIVLVTENGGITINDGLNPQDGVGVSATGGATSANILLDANSTGASAGITVNADILSTSGTITLRAEDNVTAAADIETPEAVVVESTVGAITFSSGTRIATDGSPIRIAADQDVTLSVVDARTSADRGANARTNIGSWGSVSVSSELGSITDQNTGSSTSLYASETRLEATVGVGVLGASNNAIITDATDLAGFAGTGGFNVVNVGPTLDVGRVSNITAEITLQNGDRGTVTSADVIDGINVDGGGAVVVESRGELTIGSTDALRGVTASGAGAGDIRIVADSDITLLDPISSASGSIYIDGEGSIDIDTGMSTAALGETVFITAETGIFSSATTAIISNAGNVRLDSTTGDITVRSIDPRTTADRAGDSLSDQDLWGNVAITAGSGSVLNVGADAVTHIFANALRIDAGGTVGLLGASYDPIATEASALAVTADAGISIVDSSTVSVTEVNTVPVTTVNADASLSTESLPSPLNDLTTNETGAGISLVAGGSLIVGGNAVSVTSGPNGNVYLEAGSLGSLVLNGGVDADGGHITLNAGASVDFNATVETAGPGTVYVDAGGSILDADVITRGGNILLAAILDISLVSLAASPVGGTSPDSTWGDVAIDSESGGVTVATGALGITNIAAFAARIEAGTTVGTTLESVETTTLSLAASSGDGVIAVTSTGDLTVAVIAPVSVNAVSANTLTATLSQGAALADLTTSGGSGSIILEVAGGTLTIFDGDTDGLGVSATGTTANILLDVSGTAGAVAISADILSNTGNITLDAATQVTLSADIATASDSAILIQLDDGFTMDAGTVVQTNGGNAAIIADAVVLARVDLRNAADRPGSISDQTNWGSLAILADSVLDSDESAVVNIFAQSLLGEITAGFGELGLQTDPIETELLDISLISSTGVVAIAELTDLTVSRIDPVAIDSVASDASENAVSVGSSSSDIAAFESIVLTLASGSLTIEDGSDVDGLGIDSVAGNILISAIGGAISANASVVAANGAVFLNADLGVSLGSGVSIEATGGDIRISSSAGSLTMDATADVTSNGSDIGIFVTGSASIGLLDASTDGTSPNGGTVTVVAGNSVTDVETSDANLDVIAERLKVDAGGSVGADGVQGALEVEVDVLVAASASGISFVDPSALLVSEIGSVLIDTVTSSGTVVEFDNAAVITGLSVSGDGSIYAAAALGLTLRESIATGLPVVDVAGAGFVRLANNTSGSLTIDGDVISAGRLMTLYSAGDIEIQNDSRIEFGGAVAADVSTSLAILAPNGSISFSPDATVVGSSGISNLAMRADGDIIVTGLSLTGSVSLSSVSGSILSANTALIDVTAASVQLDGQAVGTSGVGAETFWIDTDEFAVQSVNAVNLRAEGPATVTSVSTAIEIVEEDATISTATGELEDIVATNGPVIITGGALTITDAANVNATVGLTTAGNTYIDVDSLVIESDITIGGLTAISTAGNLTIAPVLVTLGADATLSAGGFVWMQASASSAATLELADASISISAASEIVVGLVDAGMGSVFIDAGEGVFETGFFGGSAGSTEVDFAADSLAIISGGPVGFVSNERNPLETEVNSLSVTADGGIEIDEVDDLIVGDISIIVGSVDAFGQTIAPATVFDSGGLTVTNSQLVDLTAGGSVSIDGLASGQPTVSISGGGQTVIDASGAFDLSDTVETDGAITILASAADLASDAAIQSTRGTLALIVSGALSMTQTSSIITGGLAGEDIFISIDADSILGTIDAGGARIAIVSETDAEVVSAAGVAENITAAGLLLSGLGSVGTPTAPILISGGVLAVSASGSTFLQAAAGVSVDTTGGTAQGYDQATGDSVSLTWTGEDIVTSTGASFILSVQTGDLVLNGGADSTGLSVGGRLRLEAEMGVLTLNAAATSGDTTTLGSFGDIEIAASVSVTVQSGDLLVSARESIVGESDSVLLVEAGDLAVTSLLGDIAVDLIDAGAGTVILEASQGGVTGLIDEGDVDVVASALAIVADSNIVLDTTIALLSATSSSGDIIITGTQATTVGDFTVTIDAVDSEGEITNVTTDRESILEASGNIDVSLSAGDFIIAADSSGILGNVLTIAVSAGRFELNADAVISGAAGGDEAVAISATSILLNASVDIQRPGNMNLVATSGDVLMADGIQLLIPQGEVAVTATTDIVLSIIDTSGPLSLTAGGAISDGLTGEAANILAPGSALTISGGTSFGFGDDVDVDIEILRATLVTGGSFAITELSGTLNIERLDLLTTTSSDSVIVNVLDGDLDVSADGIAIAGDATTEFSASGSINIQAAVSLSGDGDHTFTAGGSILVAAGITAASDVDFAADSGSFAMVDGVVISSSANISITTTGDISLAAIETSTGDIILTSDAGAVLDISGNEQPNLVAQSLIVSTETGFGSLADLGLDIDSAVTSISIANGSSGVIVLDEADGLEILSGGIVQGSSTGAISLDLGAGPSLLAGDILSRGIGPISINAAGGLTALPASAIASEDAPITISVTGNVAIATVTAGNGQDLAITSTGAITDSDQDSLVNLTGGTIAINAGEGIGSGDAVEISTPMTTVNVSSGGINLVNRFDGIVSVPGLVATNGDIVFEQVGGDRITLDDVEATNGSVTLIFDSPDAVITSVVTGPTGALEIIVRGDADLDLVGFEVGSGGVSIVSEGTITTGGTFTSNGEGMRFAGDFVFDEDSTFTTGGGDLEFTGSVDGNVVILIDTAGGSMRFGGDLGTVNAPVSVEVRNADLIRIDGRFVVDGDIFFLASALEFLGGEGSIATLNSGTLTLLPVDAGADLGLGASTDTNPFNLRTVNLLALADGFAEVLFGSEVGTGTVTIGSAVLLDRFSIRVPGAGGRIIIEQGAGLTVADGDDLDLIGGSGNDSLFSLEQGASIQLTGGGDLLAIADVFALNSSAASISGTGDFVISPATVGRDIVLAGSDQVGTLALVASELDTISSTFASLVIGRIDGNGQIDAFGYTYGSEVAFVTSGAGGRVNFLGPLATIGDDAGIMAMAGSTIEVQASISINGVGDLSLFADTVNDGDGDILIAQTAAVSIAINDGNIELNGNNIILGSDLGAMSMTALSGSLQMIGDVNADGVGAIELENSASSITIGGDIIIIHAIPDADFVGGLVLTGDIRVLGTMTVMVNGNLDSTGLDLDAFASISIDAIGDISIEGGIFRSVNGQVLLTADSDGDGIGTLNLGTSSNALVSAQEDLELVGENILIGSDVSFAKSVSVLGELALGANADGNNTGDISAQNSDTSFESGGDILIGANPAIRPVDVTILNATLTASGSIETVILGEFNTRRASYNSAGSSFLRAGGDVVIDNTDYFSQGEFLEIEAGFGDGPGDRLRIGNVSIIEVRQGDLTLIGPTISIENDQVIFRALREFIIRG